MPQRELFGPLERRRRTNRVGRPRGRHHLLCDAVHNPALPLRVGAPQHAHHPGGQLHAADGGDRLGAHKAGTRRSRRLAQRVCGRGWRANRCGRLADRHGRSRRTHTPRPCARR